MSKDKQFLTAAIQWEEGMLGGGVVILVFCGEIICI